MIKFTEWIKNRAKMETADYFQQSDYQINGQIYSVPKLAEWAKKNLRPTQLAISEIQRRVTLDGKPVADKLFVDPDDPNDEWASRSMGTELNFPILMLQYPDGKWEIIDGNHRTWKAWKSNMKTINGYLLPSDQLPPPDQLNY
jgi:hypothetical protein